MNVDRKRLSDNQTLALSIIGAVLAIAGFGMLLSIAPDWVNPPPAAPTPSGIAVGKYREKIEPVALVDQNGQATSLASLRGRPTLVALGYTSCPDVCPLTLADFKAIKRELGADGARANFAMIFVDVARDTPTTAKKLIDVFDPAFVGLTGDKAAIDKAVAEFDGVYSLQAPQSDGTGYLVAHTSSLYLLDADGIWRVQYPFQTDPKLIAADMRKLAARAP